MVNRCWLLLPLCWLLIGCTSDPLDQFEWLEGTWVQHNKGVETWHRTETGTWKGRGGSFVGQDTTWYEALAIETHEGTVQYLPDVPHNQGTVPFSLNLHEENTWEFINLEHDFPTHIRYTFQAPDSLIVVVSGPDSAGIKTLDFRFQKVDDGK